MKQKLFWLITIILFACSCTKNEEVKLDLANIEHKIENLGVFSNLIEMDKNELETIYDFDFQLIDEYLVFMPENATETANMYMILKVKNGKMNDVKNMINNFTTTYRSQYELYFPDAVESIQNHLEKIREDYLIYIISNNNERVYKTIIE